MSCDLTSINLNSCNSLSVGGIQSVTLFPFGDLYDFTFTDNDTNYITDYRRLSVGVDIKFNTNSSSFSESLVRDSVYRFNQILNLTFGTLDEDKRGAFHALLERPITALVKDKNGLCWILGQQSPLKMTSYNAPSGTPNDVSRYDIVLEGLHRDQIRRIKCIDEVCGASVNGLLRLNSQFTIEDFTTNYTTPIDIEIQANNFTLDGVLSPFEPLLWSSDPSIYQRDLTLLETIIGPYGAITSLTYNAVTDDLEFYITSNNTLFPLLSLNGTQYSSITSQFLNITVVGGSNQMQSTITLSDESTTLYSNVPYGDDVTTGPDFYGTSNNIFINVEPYVGGETFTVETSGNCGITSLTYNLPQVVECSTDFTVTPERSYSYKAEYRKAGGDFDYTYTQVYFNGITSVLLPLSTSWTNDIQVFTTELTNVLSNYTDIDISTLTVTDNGFVTTIEFDANINDGDFFIFNWRSQVSRNNEFNKTIGVFDTFTNNDSLITVTSTSGSYSGNYGQPISSISGNYNVLTLPSVTNNTNNLALELDVFAEDEIFTGNSNSLQCPDALIDFTAVTQYEDTIKTNVGTYKRFEMPYTNLGRNFIFLTNSGNYFLYTANDITPTNIKDFGIALKSQLSSTFKLLNLQYDWFAEVFHLEILELDPNVSILDFDFVVDTVSYIDDLDVWNYDITPLLHPNIEVTWSFPTNSGFWVNQSDIVQNPFKGYKENEYLIGTFINNTGGLFDVTLSNMTATMGSITINFHVGYPTSSNIVDTLVITNPDTVGSIDIQANPDYLNITHLSFTTGTDMIYVMNWNYITSDVNVDVVNRTLLRNYWGSFGSVNVLSEKYFNHVAYNEVLSLEAPVYRPDATYWFNPRESNVNNTNNIVTNNLVTTTKGSNVVTITSTGSVLEVGDIINFGYDEYYIVQDVVGNNITLHSKYNQNSDTNVDVFRVYFPILPNSIISSPLTTTINVPEEVPTFVYDAVNGRYGLRLEAPQYYVFLGTLSPTFIFAATVNIKSLGLETIFSKSVNDPLLDGSQKLTVDFINNEVFSFNEDDSGQRADIYNGYPQDELVLLFSFDETIGQLTLSINGVETVSSRSYTTFNNVINILLGAAYDGTNIIEAFNGNISEVIIDVDNTISKRRIYEGYLAWKSGLEGLLPASHPYKNEAPNYDNI